MEQHSRFDEAIKAKLGVLEDEPSVRVWQGVGDRIGTIRPPRSNPWVLRVAAAAAVVALVGIGYTFLPEQDPARKAMAIHRKTSVQRIQIVPPDYEGKNGIFITQEDKEKQAVTPAPQHRETLRPTTNSLAHSPDRTSTKHPAPVKAPLMPDPDSEPEQRMVHQEAPQRNLDSQKNPQFPTPDVDEPKWDSPVEENEESHKAVASNVTKRSIRMPSRDDLSADNLRSKSGAILGAVTHGASEFLGLNASYAEQDAEDSKMTAFNADFGLFKIKRVKTVKQ